MLLEIERKFLISSDDFKNEAQKKTYIKQGFLSTDKERTVRIRIRDHKGFITIKGKSNQSGTTRFEWEKEIPVNEAEQLLNLCQDNIIEKYRYIVPSGSHIYEVDEFLGIHKGLIIGEIELKTEDEKFNKPKWIGKEVTGQAQYYNSELSKKNYNY